MAGSAGIRLGFAKLKFHLSIVISELNSHAQAMLVPDRQRVTAALLVSVASTRFSPFVSAVCRSLEPLP
ncbi:hypothetical protein AOQ73_29430 [Bradyrhizobium pachyrhizi]|uniref:hypothetical protein n=1 Tax=Bradyrhizobium pachyrhizi TaxID=280333 RepID=UPI0007153677|nr:hypothetical protein [Bradyrhizobium pachyrhizi]KRP88115.1 hypothetical protein AOQ73_29430 [Bradyrhizobium pachyrhizi]